MNEKEKKPTSKKRIIAYYLILAGCILLIAAITVTLVLTLGQSNDIQIEAPSGTDDGNTDDGNTDGGGSDDTDNNNGDNGGSTSDGDNDGGTADSGDGDTASTASAYEFIIPIASVSVTNSYTFHYNKTLNCYYLHEGIDFAADIGTEVYAALDGTVESITTGDELYGTVITLTHANNITTTYTFVEAVEGLSVGDTVSRGDVIATVAEAVGIEYKDGPHLHFEIYENGELIDPETKLAISDK